MQCIYSLKNIQLWVKNNKRTVFNIVKYVLISTIVGIISFFILCRLEVNAHVYFRSWLSPPKKVKVAPLSLKCFNASNTRIQGQERFNVNFVPGIPVWESNTCYDFAGLFNSTKFSYNQPTLYHTFWSSNLTNHPVLQEKEISILNSFLFTQNKQNTKLIVWINEPDLANIQDYFLDKRVSFKTVDLNNLIKDTPIQDHPTNNNEVLKMLILYKFGGVWFDLNTIFIRDLSPLLEHEWISQGNCMTGMFGNPFVDSGIYHFKQNSPYVCEMLSTFVQQPQAKEIYYETYRKLLHHNLKPWSILPWCFNNPSQCKKSNSLPDLFKSNPNINEKRVLQAFAYHWKGNHWSSKPGKLFKFIDALSESNKQI